MTEKQINDDGDPKQDVMGWGQFRKIIDKIGTNNVSYIKTCYRCPQKHLNLSTALRLNSSE